MPDHELVLHGATGFVGKLTARHLRDCGAKVALSGRSRDKLEAVRRELDLDWPLVVVDASDASGLQDLAASTRAVATTVGPYAKHGMPLLEACARAGTHYADLTGEVHFVRDAIEGSHKVAVDTGAKVVPSAGFDSVPSDLGVWLLHQQVVADGEGDLEDTVLLVKRLRGGVSGGTIDSLRGQMDVVKKDAEARRLMFDPHALSPDKALEPPAARDVMRPTRDPLLGQWVAPFVMAPYNSRVVRRSNALLGHAYGPQWTYREVMSVGSTPLAPVLAGGVSAGVGALVAGLALPPTRWVLDKVLPKPGEGPSEKAQANGHFTVEVHGRTSTGARYVATIADDRDPGYSSTAVMLGQAGLALALDDLPAGGGVLTPAVALGSALVDRLKARGFRIDVRRLEG